VERLSTGIPQLDTILGGGLPVGSLTVLTGDPGTGKTILAQQICFNSGTREHKAVYYSTISEPPGKFIANLATFDFFDRSALVDRIEFINLGELLQAKQEDGLVSMMEEIARKCVEEHPSVVVVDSARALRDFSDSERSLRSAIYKLAARISHTDTTLIFVGEYSSEEIASTPEFSLADGIMELVYEPHQPMDRRWLRVRKLRSSNPLSGQHPLRITEAGVAVYVRAETLNGHLQSVAEPKGRIAIGVPGLDEMCHGGLPKGGSTIALGPSGCGKTALALRFIVQGLEEGERGLYVTFQENPAQLIRKAASFGWELRPYLESGQLAIYHVPESSLDLDVVASVVREHLAEAPLQRMVIDSLAEMVLAAREAERFSAYARALLGTLRAAGVSVLTTSETSSLGPMTDPVGGLSFLYHNVLLLRYIEQDSEVGRAVAILKMRNSAHEKGLWKFIINDHGFQILEKLEGVSGLLGWTVLSDSPATKSASRHTIPPGTRAGLSQARLNT
jgi:circadian clock protein KaiC